MRTKAPETGGFVWLLSVVFSTTVSPAPKWFLACDQFQSIHVGRSACCLKLT